MSLNSLMRWIKPNEQVFFDLLDASAANVLEAARLFDRELRTEDPAHWAELRRQMKTLEHKGDDAHLHFNIARAQAESGNLEGAVAHLETALSLDAGFEAALKYRDYLAKNGAPGAAAEAGAQS